jgi:hypothetical protein
MLAPSRDVQFQFAFYCAVAVLSWAVVIFAQRIGPLLSFGKKTPTRKDVLKNRLTFGFLAFISTYGIIAFIYQYWEWILTTL